MPSRDSLSVETLIEEGSVLPEGLSEASLASLVRYVLAAEGASGRWQLGFRFLDDWEMQQAHLTYMGIDTPTDIMTFPYERETFDDLPGLGGEEAHGGDLMISIDRAKEHARDAGWSAVDELRFLVVHGVLHLLGWNDATDAGRSRMLDRQKELLEAWSGRCNP